jgi:hypothetical protein
MPELRSEMETLGRCARQAHADDRLAFLTETRADTSAIG